METKTPSTNELILALREKTGAGMMDCKKALTESGGDFDKAVESLRKKGLADAAKRSARATKEGVVACSISPDGRKGALLELTCETDFVAKTDDFQKLAADLARRAAEGTLASPEAASALVAPVIAKVGENITVRRFERFELKGPGLLASYVHPVGFKQGAFLELSAASEAAAKSPAALELAKELGLQIVAMRPRWVSRAEVPPAEVEKEGEIVRAQIKNDPKLANKPEQALAGIIQGKVDKLFFQAFCLLDMVSMRDNKTPISKLVQEASAKAEGALTVRRFVRYQLGE